MDVVGRQLSHVGFGSLAKVSHSYGPICSSLPAFVCKAGARGSQPSARTPFENEESSGGHSKGNFDCR